MSARGKQADAHAASHMRALGLVPADGRGGALHVADKVRVQGLAGAVRADRLAPTKQVAPAEFDRVQLEAFSGNVEQAFYNVKATGHVAKLLRDLKISA